MTYQNLIAHNARSPVRPNYEAASIKVDGFMSELSSLVRGRLDHADSGEKWKWTQAERKLEAFENRNKIKAYVQLRLHDGADRCDLQEQIIAEYLLPQSEEKKAGGDYDPYERLSAQNPLMNARGLSDLVLSKMAAGVPGFNVKEVAFTYKTHPDHVDAQLKEYVNRKSLERADEVAQGSVRKMRFEHSIEQLPEVFFDFSPYKPRYTGGSDCAIISFGVAEGQTYKVAAASMADTIEMGDATGVTGVELLSHLTRNDYILEMPPQGTSLETLWDSDLIGVSDAGIIMIQCDEDKSHAIGFRDGKMHVSDPIIASQLYGSCEVLGVYLKKSSSEASQIRADRALKNAVRTREPVYDTKPKMSPAEIESLEKSLVDSILSSLSERFGGGPEHIREVV